MIDVALALVRAGLRVHPLKAGTKDQPLTEHGCIDAAGDAGVVAKWWGRWPRANVGIAAGEYDGRWLFCVDTDPRHGGDRWLVRHWCWFRPTWVVRTGGGGLQFWYFSPAEVRNSVGTETTGIAPGVDVRGHHGYGLAPGSVHPSGARYECLYGSPYEIAWAGDNLLHAVTNPRRSTPKPALAVADRPGTPTRTVSELVEWALGRTSVGNRNWVGYLLARQLLAHGHGIEGLLEYQRRVPGTGYTEEEARRSWHSATNRDVLAPWPKKGRVAA